MNGNDISSLPSSVSKLENLKQFEAQNATGKFPKSIGDLPSLSKLELSESILGQIPE